MSMQPLRDDEDNLGTTIIGMVFSEGVILGADSRTSLGSYVSNRISTKISSLHQKIFCCRSGSAADTSAIIRMVKSSLSKAEFIYDEAATTHKAAQLLRRICYKYRTQLLASLILGGWDEKTGGSVYGIPLGGSLHKGPLMIAGSGSAYIAGFCDSQFKEGMTREEAIAFLKKAVSLAMHRDGSSGGLVRMTILTRAGAEHLVFSGASLPSF